MCQHPNIIKLLDLFENADYYYIVIEYMEGKDLFDYLKSRNFQISERRGRELALQIAEAIQYLHSYGIVHRDIKLENVMMSSSADNAVPKLVDFGLARIIGPT
jgi:serine/threonine protein kinase